MLRTLLIGGLLSFAVLPVWGRQLDFNINSDTAQVGVQGALSLTEFGRSGFNVSVLFADRKPEDNVLFEAGLAVAGEAGTDAPGLEFGVGLSVLGGQVGSADVGALELGGGVRYAPPSYSRFFVAVGIGYAPQIVTFNDADEVLRTLVRLGYELLPEAQIYLGYREWQFELTDGTEVQGDKGGHFGVTFRF